MTFKSDIGADVLTYWNVHSPIAGLFALQKNKKQVSPLLSDLTLILIHKLCKTLVYELVHIKLKKMLFETVSGTR